MVILSMILGARPEEPGVLIGAHIEYNDSGSVHVTAGRGNCTSKYWVIEDKTTTAIDVDDSDVFNGTFPGPTSGFDVVYFYILNSEINNGHGKLEVSNDSTTDIETSLTEPSWNDEWLGYYNGNNRCIGAFIIEDGSIIPFTNAEGTIHLADRILFYDNEDPTGSWSSQTPDTETDTLLPVMASEAWINIRSKTTGITAKVWAASYENSLISGNINEIADLLTAGYMYARITGWIPLGSSRKIRVTGDDDDDNGELYAGLRGFKIRR